MWCQAEEASCKLSLKMFSHYLYIKIIKLHAAKIMQIHHQERNQITTNK